MTCDWSLDANLNSKKQKSKILYRLKHQKSSLLSGVIGLQIQHSAKRQVENICNFDGHLFIFYILSFHSRVIYELLGVEFMIWKWHRILAPVLRYLKIKILSYSEFGFLLFENLTSRNMQRICVIASRGKTEGSRMCSNLNSRSSRSYTSLTWATPWVSSETKRRCLKRASMKCFWKTWMEQLWETVDSLEQKWCRKIFSQKKNKYFVVVNFEEPY